MVKHKSHAKKPAKGGVDFKKFKRKVGRKLPPPRNATNTDVKFKAIVLPEQSIVSEKDGLAVTKKGLTLKELLQNTNRPSAKDRKNALVGIKEILLNHPSELKLHRLAIIEKLRERIGDEDRIVRETLFQVFKAVVFPNCAKENSGQLVSLLMAYIFNAMTHLTSAVRLTAFKFLDLVFQFFPLSYFTYADKVFQNYGDILLKNELLEDKSKLRSILVGFFHCLKLLPNNGSDKPAVENHPYQESLQASDAEIAIATRVPTEITGRLKDLIPILVRCFLEFMPTVNNGSQIDTRSCSCMHLILQSMDLTIRYLVAEVYAIDEVQQLIPHQQKPGVGSCDMLFSMLKKLWKVFPLNMPRRLSDKDDDSIFMLNTVIVKIFLQFRNWDNVPSALMGEFIEFITISLDTLMDRQKRRVKRRKERKFKQGRDDSPLQYSPFSSSPSMDSLDDQKSELGMLHEDFFLPLIPHIPKLKIKISFDLWFHILQAFTNVFKKSKQSSLKLACISAISEMLASEMGLSSLDSSHLSVARDKNCPSVENDAIFSWLRDLPSLLLLDDKNLNPSCYKAVLRLQLFIGQSAPSNSLYSQAFDQMQDTYKHFFSSDNKTCYGPFLGLPADIQELAISSLYYFSSMDPELLQSILYCCLCDDIQNQVPMRISEVLQSTFRAGRIPVGDYTSFLFTLLSRFPVKPDVKLNWRTFTTTICSHLSSIGDKRLVFVILEKAIVDQICGELPLHNKSALLRLLATLDSKPTQLSDWNICRISEALPQYLINVASSETSSDAKSMQYDLLPCFHLFSGSAVLLNRVVSATGCRVSDTNPVLSVLLHMCRDEKMVRILASSCRTEMERLLQKLLSLLGSERMEVGYEERQRMVSACDMVRLAMGLA